MPSVTLSVLNPQWLFMLPYTYQHSNHCLRGVELEYCISCHDGHHILLHIYLAAVLRMCSGTGLWFPPNNWHHVHRTLSYVYLQPDSNNPRKIWKWLPCFTLAIPMLYPWSTAQETRKWCKQEYNSKEVFRNWALFPNIRHEEISKQWFFTRSYLLKAISPMLRFLNP